MKLRSMIKFIVLGFLLAATSAAAEDYEWTKSAISKVDKKGDKGSFILGNGAVHFFPEVSEEEAAMERAQDEVYTVYDRFRVIVTIASYLELDSNGFRTIQNVPTSELLPILRRTISANGAINVIKQDLESLTVDFADYAQYRIKE